MVYLREILRHNRDKILQFNNIEMAAYLFVSSAADRENYNFELSPDEKIALKGYKGESVENKVVSTILNKPSIKGISATSNVYKLCGLYLASRAEVDSHLKEKYFQSDLLQKYFISKIAPSFLDQLKKEVIENVENPISVVISKIFANATYQENDFDETLKNVLKGDIDIQKQILLEDLEDALIKIKYVNKSSDDIVKDVLANFSNAVQKIIKDRRKDHQSFPINDEYDVQDILYVILKSLFPLLRDEDPIAKVGAKSTKIDLILREEKILVEVKMLKEKDSNEVEFIEQLKKDLESYHQCQWLEKLYCFVYDPFKKTRDEANFTDLNGERIKNGHKFSVEVILSN